METTHPKKTPVFTDESGRRATVMQWAARGVCAVCLVVAGAVVFTLTTHVPLPGLERILSPRTGSEATHAVDDGSDTGRRSLGAVLTTVTTRGNVSTTYEGSVGTRAAQASRASVLTTTRAVSGGSGRPQAQPTSPAAHASVPRNLPDNANPHATAKSSKSSNPYAAAKGENSSVSAQGGSTKAPNPRAVDARAKAAPSSGPSATPPRAKD